MFQIADDQLAEIRRILTCYVPDARVVAFGSRVLGTARRYSDLDLAVYVRGGLASAVLASLREAFQDSDLPFTVDVSDGTRLPDWLQAEVRRIGLPIQDGSGPGDAAALQR